MSSYASTTDLTTYGLPSTALGSLTLAAQQGAVDAASAVVDTFFRGRYSLPLTAWGPEVTEATCRIAAYNLLNVRGYNAAAGADENIRLRYEDAMRWLQDVQKRAAHPNVTEASNNGALAQPVAISSSVVDVSTGATARTRGW